MIYQNTTTMTQKEREAVIDKIIRSQHRGAGKIDYLVYNDKFNALSKQTDEYLLKQNSNLN